MSKGEACKQKNNSQSDHLSVSQHNNNTILNRKVMRIKKVIKWKTQDKDSNTGIFA